MISLTYISHTILIPEVIGVHHRPLEVKIRSTLKNACRHPMLIMNTHMISLTNISYEILTQKVIGGQCRSVGHWRSKRGNLKKTHGHSFLHTYLYDIVDQNVYSWVV